MASSKPGAARSDVFFIVANSTRRQILDLLRLHERPAGELVAAFPRLPQPAVSRHLRILREAGLVDVRPSAQRRIYRLRPNRMREIDGWVSPYRQFWSDRLEAGKIFSSITEGKRRSAKKSES